MAVATLKWTDHLPRMLWASRTCPLCSSVEFKTAEAHPLDGALRLFALRPVRCVNCWRRYYWFAKTDVYPG